MAIDPIIVAFVAKNAPKGSLGTTLSAYNFIGMSGAILAPYITGFLADKFGTMKVGFYFAVALMILGLLAFSTVKEDKNVKEAKVS